MRRSNCWSDILFQVKEDGCVPESVGWAGKMAGCSVWWKHEKLSSIASFLTMKQQSHQLKGR
jgi:hypothetical protein